MKFIGKIFSLAAALGLSAAAVAAEPTANGASPAELRTWTSVSGAQIQAVYLRTEGEMVKLQKPTGGAFAIRRSLLSPADLAYVAEQEKKAVGSTAISGLRTSALIDRDMILSSQEADAMRHEWIDPKNQTRYGFSADFSLNPSGKKSWKEGTPIEFKINADAYRRTAKTSSRENTKCYMYLLDDQNQPVMTKAKSVDSMCPT